MNMIDKIRSLSKKYAPLQLALLQEFASFDSETKDMEGNRLVVELVKKTLEPLHAEIKEVFYEGVGTHVIATIPAVDPEHAGGRILLNSHLDTVFPKGYAAKYPWHIEGDKLYGLGVTDCKGGFVVSAFAVRIACELGILPNREIVMLYTCDEEQGSETARFLFQKEAENAECAFIFEGGRREENEIGLITQRKGVILGSMDISGVEAHAGSAYLEGHSAVLELSYKIQELYALNDYERGIYYNAAPVSGGRPNGVVAADAHMEFCCAGIPDNRSYAECEKKIAALGNSTHDPLCQVSVRQRMLFPALERTKKASEMVALAARAGSILGMNIREIAVPSASDANYFSYYGCPAVDAFGPHGGNIHTVEEYVEIPTIQEKTELFAAFLYALKET